MWLSSHPLVSSIKPPSTRALFILPVMLLNLFIPPVIVPDKQLICRAVLHTQSRVLCEFSLAGKKLR